MTHSDRERHRDRDGRKRELVDESAPAGRVFRITDEERQAIAESLRYIDEARREIQNQQNAANREIIRELKASADRIFELINNLEEIGTP
jgi:flagellar biosynthesis/type III secretory pathway chaperone